MTMIAVVYFNNNSVSPTTVYKHLGMFLNDKLSSEHHLNFLLNKIQKKINPLRKFKHSLPRQILQIFYLVLFRLC